MRFPVYATRTEPVDALMVQRDTFGSSHAFNLAAGTVTITLPDGPRPNCSSETLTNDRTNLDHSWFSVDEVYLRCELFEEVNFTGTEDEFNSLAVHRSDSGQKACEAVAAMLDDGFDLWKRTLRWVGLAPSIGMDEFETNHSATRGRGYKIFRCDDHLLFRNHGGTVTSHGAGKICREAWQSAGKVLSINEAPPVWFDFLHEAIQMEAIGNLRVAVINSAIAAETVLRSVFRATLPTISSITANRILDQAAAQSLLSRWEEMTGTSKVDANKQGRKAVHELFDLRNVLMHEGLRDRHQLKKISILIPKTTKFILAADQFISLTRALPQRIFISPRVLERLTAS